MKAGASFSLLVDGFALGSIGASAPNLTQAADVVQVYRKKLPSHFPNSEAFVQFLISIFERHLQSE
jgi:hypothetical protein